MENIELNKKELMTNKKYLPFEEVEAWVAFECVRLDIDIVAL